MAIDEALLACFDPEKSLPILRLYGWQPPAFSFGKFQNPGETLSLEKCRAAGIQVMRRITGGGLLYHGQELTYSLVCPASFVSAASGVKNGFFYLTSFLVGFYRELGLDALYAADHYRGSRQLGERSALCFAGTESCDILIKGRKIGGNAQRRLKGVIFQHGSIPLLPLVAESQQYLLAPAPEIITATTSLADEGIALERDTLAQMLAGSFASVFDVELAVCQLSGAERAAASTHIQKTA
jgi:lipoate-protein ligase A